MISFLWNQGYVLDVMRSLATLFWRIADTWVCAKSAKKSWRFAANAVEKATTDFRFSHVDWFFYFSLIYNNLDKLKIRFRLIYKISWTSRGNLNSWSSKILILCIIFFYSFHPLIILYSTLKPIMIFFVYPLLIQSLHVIYQDDIRKSQLVSQANDKIARTLCLIKSMLFIS